MARRRDSDVPPPPRGVLGPYCSPRPSDLLDRACARIDRRAGGGIRRGRGGGGSRADASAADVIYAVTNFSLQNFLATGSDGGEPGIATGFGAIVLFRLDALDTNERHIQGRISLTGLTGWQQFLQGNALGASFRTNAWTDTARPTFTQSDVGKLHVAVSYAQPGAPNITPHQWLNRAEPLPASVAGHAAPYTPAAAATQHAMGTRIETPRPGLGISIVATATFHGTPTDAQFHALFDDIRARGDIPDSAAGMTIRHLTSARRQLRDAPRVTRRLFGARGTLFGSYLSTITAGTLPGLAAGFSRSVRIIVTQLTSSASGAVVASQNTANMQGGWNVYISASGTIFWSVRYSSPSSALTSTSYALTASDLNVPLVLSFGIDSAGMCRMYLNGVEVGTAATTNGSFVPAAASPFMLLSRVANDFFGDRIVVLEAMGDELPITAQYAADTFAATQSADKLTAPAGRAQVAYYDVNRDMRDAGGVIPAQIADRAGALPLTRVTLTLADGGKALGPFVGLVYYATAAGGGIQGQSAGFWVAVEFTLTVTSGTGMLVGVTNGSATQGWFLQITSNALWFSIAPGTAKIGRALTAADLNRRIRVLMQLQADGTLRAWFDGVELTPYAGAVFTAPVTLPMILGLWKADTQVFTQGAVYAVQGGHTTLTDAEALSVFAPAQGLAAVAGKTMRRYVVQDDVAEQSVTQPPVVLADRMASADALRRVGGLLEAVAHTSQVPARPAALEDLVTKASADALIVKGAPVITEIDTSRDGRRSFGAMGFVAQLSRYQTANGAGIRGHQAGFHVRVVFVPSVFSGDGYLAACSTSSGSQGWSLLKNGANIRPYFGNGSTTSFPSTAMPTSWLQGVHLVEFVFDGTQAWTVLDGVAGTPVAASFVPAAASLPMTVGAMVGGSWAVPDAIYALAGSNTVPTPTESLAAYQSWMATGKLPRTNHASEHYYDLTLDFGPTESVTATVLDRAGTDHLTRVGALDVQTLGGIRGVGPYGPNDYWRTEAGGGFAGAASGAHWVLDVQWLKTNTTDEALLRYGMGAYSKGLFIQVLSGGRVRGATAGGAFGTIVTLAPGDVGKRFRILIQKTATALQTWVNGVQAADVASAVYNVPTADMPMVFGSGPAIEGAQSFAIELVQGGNTTLTAGEITALFADLTQPAPIAAGKTERRWRFDQDIAAAGGVVPVKAVERIGGQAIDALTRVTAPLQVAQRTERVWPYETTPIAKVGGGFSTTNRWQSALGKGIRGSPMGLHVGVVCRIRGTGTGRFLSYSNGGPTGWNFYAGLGTQVQFSIVAADGTNKTAPTVSVAADAKLRCIMGTLDVATGHVRAFQNRVQVGTGTVAAGYATTYLADLPTTLGGLFGGAGNPDVEVLGFVGGDVAVTLAEVQAWEDVCMAAEDIRPIPGKSEHMYSLRARDGAGGLLDLIGSDHLPIVGTPTVADVYARAWAA